MTYLLKNALKRLILWALEETETEYLPSAYPSDPLFDFDEVDEGEGESAYIPDDGIERENFEGFEPLTSEYDRETIEKLIRQDSSLTRATREE